MIAPTTFTFIILFELLVEVKSATFETKLVYEVSKFNKNGNFIISPASIRSCLGLIYMGAEGETAKELQNVLQLKGHSKEEAGKQFRAYMKKIEDSDKIIRSASRFYLSKAYTVSKDYQYRARKYFSAETENVDFRDIETFGKINAWIEAQTMHYIKHMVDHEKVRNLDAVVVNAIYFKANWKVHFKVHDEKQDFYLNDTEKVQVDMIFVRDTFNYARLRDMKATAIEIPYNKTELRMLLLLPFHPNGLVELEQKLNNFDLTKIKFQRLKLRVGLPKFKIEYGMSLKNALSYLGIKLIYHGGDLSGIVSNKNGLNMSDIFHKGYIELDEKGTRAAAATTPLERANREFIANRPFLFAIKDHETIYFAGHFTRI